MPAWPAPPLGHNLRMADFPHLRWDLFCKVIDNHGDLGVCWRLARQLVARGQQVRLWVDEPSALTWMAPGALQGRVPGITVLPWTQPIAPELLSALPPADVWVEAFGCEIAPEFIASRASGSSADGQNDAPSPPVWINLEYLSAEAYVERMHGLPSPVLHGPGAGWTKWFFYPGFTPRTGGLMRGPDPLALQAGGDRSAWLKAQGLGWQGEPLVSLFCYEPPLLAELLARWSGGPTATQLLVTAGRSAAAVQRALEPQAPSPPASRHWGPLAITYLPYLPQTEYDRLLWACDLNFVRGEDSLARALWAGVPFVWQIYPQHDEAHHAKLAAFLDWLDAPPSLRQFHLAWNGIEPGPLPKPEPGDWRACVQAARARLLTQPDLCSQLLHFVVEKRYNSRLCE